MRNSLISEDCERELLRIKVKQLRQRVAELETQLSEVRKAERERCAKVCKELRHPDGYSGENVDWCDGTDHCAAAIRAMGDE